MSRYFLACVLVMSLVVVFLTLYFARATDRNRFVVLDGEFESIKIGATHSELLDLLVGQEIRLMPRTATGESSGVWMDASQLSGADRNQLVEHPAWFTRDIGSSVCPPERDGQATLRFKDGKLARIDIACIEQEP